MYKGSYRKEISMTREDFMDKYGFSAEDFSHIPEHSDNFMTDSEFDDLIDSLILDTRISIEKFFDSIPIFSYLGVDDAAIENYVFENRDSNFTEENIDGLNFWWEV